MRSILCIAGFWGAAAAASTAFAGTSRDCSRLPQANAAPPVLSADVRMAPQVARSALRTFSAHDIREVQTKSAEGASSVLVLVHKDEIVPLVAIGRQAGANATQISIFSPATSLLPEEIRLSASENLYAFLMQQAPQDHFAFANSRAPLARKRTLSHAEALTVVSEIRACAAAALTHERPDLKITSWQTALIKPLLSRGAHGLLVGARVHGADGKPLAGQLTFARGGHLACSAALEKDGQGSCTLFDSHGHALHDDDLAEATTVTYSGAVSVGRIVLPTTLAYRAHRRR